MVKHILFSIYNMHAYNQSTFNDVKTMKSADTVLIPEEM